MQLEELQARLAERFLPGDREMGLPFLGLVLVEELGELATALRRGDEDAVGEEVVDVVFLALCVANLAGAEVEAALRRKYVDRPVEEVAASWDDVSWR